MDNGIFDTLIVGAGAAGLMAMHDLTEAGMRVCMLEATGKAGGRMATENVSGFEEPVEKGAEFVHGSLPLTLSKLDKAGITYTAVEGDMIAIENGQWQNGEAHDKHWDTFMQRLKELTTDMSIRDVLNMYFADEKYTHLRDAVKRYAEGFDLADISDASAKAAALEWSEDEPQFRVNGGYQQLVTYLCQCCDRPGSMINYDRPVTSIEYDMKGVTVTVAGGEQYHARNLVLAVSAGMLQSNKIAFTPALAPSYHAAIDQLGFGSVIKVLLKFDVAFWKQKAKQAGFFLSNEKIPTWWTQEPADSCVLTGWLGGPGAQRLSKCADEEIINIAVSSLSNIFQLAPSLVQSKVVGATVANWQQHPFVMGGYSYNKVDAQDAKKILAHPLAGIIFFAGEAVHRGESQGTVEAALQSGRAAAGKIIKMYSGN